MSKEQWVKPIALADVARRPLVEIATEGEQEA